MPGTDERSDGLFSYVDLEARVRADHLLRVIRSIVNDALRDLAPDFGALCSRIGRPSIVPERLLRAMLLQAFYSVRSERQLMERLDTDWLFRWFVPLAIDEPIWDASVFSKNRDRLLEEAIAAKFLAAVLAQPRVTKLMSSEHFSVDGTLIEAWASMKSFKPKGGSGDERPRDRAATPKSISRAGSAPTRPTPRPRTRKPGFTARALAWRQNSLSSDTP
jgi:transposase